MEANLEIKIHQGLGELYFGMSIEDAIQKLGKADDIEVLDEVEEIQTTVLHYSDLGLALFFDENAPVLKCIDIYNEDILLNGQSVFDKTQEEIVAIMKGLKFFEEDIEEETWGEKRVTFLDANIDFFFEEEELISIVFGK